MSFDYDTYLSPFSWRYASSEMRQIWSEVNKRKLWRQVWLALAEAEAEFGLTTPEKVKDLREHVTEVDIARALEIEAEIHHDLMAELKTYAEQAPIGGSVLHLGATSADIEDNADVLRTRQALDLVIERLKKLLLIFSQRIEATADIPIIAMTHLQPAEPSTLGYRLASYAQDLYQDWQIFSDLRLRLRGKGLRGAVGTSASFAELIGEDSLGAFEDQMAKLLNLAFYPISTQVYPRKQDFYTISALAGLGASLYRFAFDLRVLQSPAIGELREPFGSKQVGSSAMPFKRNPIQAEKVDSLSRQLAAMPRLAWDNAAHSLLERTLDDSANRRSLLPEAFLIADEILGTVQRIMEDLQIDESAIKRNLAAYGPFAAIERVLMRLSRAGADRQIMHERLRQHALNAWAALRRDEPNPLAQLLHEDQHLLNYATAAEIDDWMDVQYYLGDAKRRARLFAAELRMRLSV